MQYEFARDTLRSAVLLLTLEDGTLVVTGNYLKMRVPLGRSRNEWVRVAIDGSNPLVGTLVS